MKRDHGNLNAGRLTRHGAAAAALLALAACNLNSQLNAVELDTQARTTGNVGRYIASAKLLEKCEAELGPEAAEVAPEERMRAYALSVQNYLKGGDVEKAAANFERFKESFSGNDLYYADGSSFIETMEVMLGRKKPSALGQYAALNVSQTLKGEMHRIRYWKRH